ncbi:MAG: DUF4267 domain-containing protein [Alphaproteobacteria bacterium]|nr:DUF4267 domain-containing protein [Alphaproteobacteria bacterium]
MPAQAVPFSPPWGAIAIGLAGAIALLQGVNAVRAFAAPAGFADYMGLPLAAPQDAGFVFVYGLRAAFIALAVAALLATRNFAALTWVAAVAIVMPIGDAVLTARAGAPTAIVARHVAIAIFLCVTALVLHLAARRAGAT